MIVHNADMCQRLEMFSLGVVLEAGKDVTFNPEDDDVEHQLDLRMVPVPLCSCCANTCLNGV